MDYNIRKKRQEVEQAYEYERWRKEIPSLNFKKKWKVRILPPFLGAIIRFRIDYKDRYVSCYLDCYNELGYFGEPYWEIYPYKDDTFRCAMKDTKVLMKKIKEVLEGEE